MTDLPIAEQYRIQEASKRRAVLTEWALTGVAIASTAVATIAPLNAAADRGIATARTLWQAAETTAETVEQAAGAVEAVTDFVSPDFDKPVKPGDRVLGRQVSDTGDGWLEVQARRRREPIFAPLGQGKGTVRCHPNGTAEVWTPQFPNTNFVLSGIQGCRGGVIQGRRAIARAGAGGRWRVRVENHGEAANVTTGAIFWMLAGHAPGGLTARNRPATEKLSTRLYAAAKKANGADVTAGPGNGRVACAWAVNRFALEPVLGQKLGSNPNLVFSVYDAAIAAGWTPIPVSSANPGYLVMHNGEGRQTFTRQGDRIVGNQHIGVCANIGCTKSYDTGGGRFRLSDYPVRYGNRIALKPPGE